ncbi:hypothetical protein Fmac_005589 [Flemingia macrophylla]|uniref:Uncharacterized protein n=1 Tax=Flemingia macrophylla TaxID=520843 RepID=A0ABD1N869_9FABA
MEVLAARLISRNLSTLELSTALSCHAGKSSVMNWRRPKPTQPTLRDLTSKRCLNGDSSMLRSTRILVGSQVTLLLIVASILTSLAIDDVFHLHHHWLMCARLTFTTSRKYISCLRPERMGKVGALLDTIGCTSSSMNFSLELKPGSRPIASAERDDIVCMCCLIAV